MRSLIFRKINLNSQIIFSNYFWCLRCTEITALKFIVEHIFILNCLKNMRRFFKWKCVCVLKTTKVRVMSLYDFFFSRLKFEKFGNHCCTFWLTDKDVQGASFSCIYCLTTANIFPTTATVWLLIKSHIALLLVGEFAEVFFLKS